MTDKRLSAALFGLLEGGQAEFLVIAVGLPVSRIHVNDVDSHVVAELPNC